MAQRKVPLLPCPLPEPPGIALPRVPCMLNAPCPPPSLTGLRCSFGEFAAHYADIFTPIPQMIAQQQVLAAAGVPTFILSNSSELHIAHCRATYPFFSG